MPASVTTREAVEAAATGDVLFSCVDTLEARQIIDMMGAAFLMPLVDVGVVIPTRKNGDAVAIADACGRIDYVFPGGSTLLDRDVYSPARVRAEYLRRTAPDQHREEVRAGYIKGLVEEAPGVITLNMRAAAAAVNKYIARAYPFASMPMRIMPARSLVLRLARKSTAPKLISNVAITPSWRVATLNRYWDSSLKRPRKTAA